jgi:hypothetical protein
LNWFYCKARYCCYLVFIFIVLSVLLSSFRWIPTSIFIPFQERSLDPRDRQQKRQRIQSWVWGSEDDSFFTKRHQHNPRLLVLLIQLLFLPSNLNFEDVELNSVVLSMNASFCWRKARTRSIFGFFPQVPGKLAVAESSLLEEKE